MLRGHPPIARLAGLELRRIGLPHAPWWPSGLASGRDAVPVSVGPHGPPPDAVSVRHSAIRRFPRLWESWLRLPRHRSHESPAIAAATSAEPFLQAVSSGGSVAMGMNQIPTAVDRIKASIMSPPDEGEGRGDR